MNVNETAYGSSSLWSKMVNSSNIPIENSPLVATYDNNTHNLANAVEQGALQFNEYIDTSIAFVGVDENFNMLSQGFYYVPEIEVGDSITESDLSLTTSIQRNNMNPMCMMCGTGGSSNSNVYAVESNHLSKFWAFKMKSVGSSLDRTLTPVTSIPMTMVWGIGVVCGSKPPDDSNYNSTRKAYDLYTYCNYIPTSDNPEKYPLYILNPYIYGVYIVPFCRNSTVVTDPDSTNTLYRNIATPYSSYGNVYLKIMNKFNTCVDPYTTAENEPLNILTYTQVTSGGVVSPQCVRLYQGDNSLNTFSSFTPMWLLGNSGTRNEVPINSMLLLSEKERVYGTRTATRDVINTVRYNDLSDFGGIEKFELWCKQQCAYTGGFFTDSFSYAQYCPEWNVTHTFIGTIDGMGVTHGEFTEGKDNEKQKQYDWDDWTQNNYNPSGRPQGSDNEQGSDPYKYNSPSFAFNSGNYYAMSTQRLNSLTEWIDKIVNPDAQFAVTADDTHYSYEQLAQEMKKLFNGQYPEDMFLSLLYYPFSITGNIQNATIQSNAPIKLGAISTTQKSNWFGTDLPASVGDEIQNANNCFRFSTSPYLISEYYGDFRDYPPYTSISLSIPFHTTTPLDVGEWYGHYLSTQMFIDVLTGCATTVIERDGIPLLTVDGQVATPIQLITRNVGQYVASLTSSTQQANALKIQTVKNDTNRIKSGLNIIMAGATFNPAKPQRSFNEAFNGLFGLWDGVVNGAEIAKGFQNLQIDLAHNQAGFSVISQSSPSVSLCFENAPRLNIRRPVTLPDFNKQVYENTVGYACMIIGEVGNLSGYSVFSNADLSGINAPESDKLELLNLLQTGVYI